MLWKVCDKRRNENIIEKVRKMINKVLNENKVAKIKFMWYNNNVNFYKIVLCNLKVAVFNII